MFTRKRYADFFLTFVYQYIAMIYRDKEMKILDRNLAGGYLSTAESKIAPLLVAGSWVGWLMDELNHMLPAQAMGSGKIFR